MRGGAVPLPLERPWPSDWAHHQNMGPRAGREEEEEIITS